MSTKNTTKFKKDTDTDTAPPMTDSVKIKTVLESREKGRPEKHNLSEKIRFEKDLNPID